jgi:hypothetical protein
VFSETLDEAFSVLKEYSAILLQILAGFHVKAPVILVRFSSDFIRFSKNLNFMKIRSVGAELLLTDRRKKRHEEAKSLYFCNFLTRLKTAESILNTPS